jgi:hypothetical protein
VAGTMTTNEVEPCPPPPPPFYRDEFLNGLAGSDEMRNSGSMVCPRLEVLRIRLVDPSDITTKALKNLVARRGVVGSGAHAHPGAAEAAILQTVWIRFTFSSPVDAVGLDQKAELPKRWREDELNAGFNGKVIRVERRKTGQYLSGGGGAGAPFGTQWESESSRFERCR